MEIVIESGHEEEQTKNICVYIYIYKCNQEVLGVRCSWGLAGQWVDGEGDWRPWRSRMRAVVCG